MRVSEAVNSRRSMRVFKPDPVPQADIEWIISTASRAASNGNLQPWKLYVTTGKARQRLSAAILKAMDDGDNGPGAEYNVYPKEFTRSTTRAASWSASSSTPCSAYRAAMPPAC